MNNTRKIILSLCCLVGVLFLSSFASSQAGAEGISVAPLKYQTNLDGQIKKGVVDITNNSAIAQNMTILIRAFKQINDKGNLEFYENSLISSGITPDYEHFELKPHETIHLFFLLNGQKLPKKQIFAALLAQATPVKASYNITPVLRVGTLLLLKNGNGDPPKQGEISNWHVGLFQFGNSVTGSFDFKNTEKGDSASGYFPQFEVRLAGSTERYSGDLFFPGIKRGQSFYMPGSRIGVYKLSLASDAGAKAEQWMIVVTGYWRWLLPLLIILVVGLPIIFIKVLKHRAASRKA